MLNSPYAYQIELYTGEGVALGRAPLAIDWEPAHEWTRFSGIRAGRIDPDAIESAATALPIWHPRAGEPYVEGFTVSMTVGDENVSSAFGADYFAPLAREIVDAIRKNGEEEKPEAVRYITTAHLAPQPEQGTARSAFVARERPPEMPIGRAALHEIRRRSGRCGEPVGCEMPVFLPRQVLDEAAALSREAGANETGGILIGHLYRDASSAELFAQITAQIPARHAAATTTSLAFTADTWTDVRHAMTLRGRSELMLGWWHSHPVREWCKQCAPEKQRECSLAKGFLSAHDRALHRTIFPRGYSIALLVNDVAFDGPTFALFGWNEGVLTRRSFEVIERGPAT